MTQPVSPVDPSPIAQALFDDPVQHDRLRALWGRLSEETA